jgi:thiamine biosynthesis lipoprotein
MGARGRARADRSAVGDRRRGVLGPQWQLVGWDEWLRRFGQRVRLLRLLQLLELLRLVQRERPVVGSQLAVEQPQLIGLLRRIAPRHVGRLMIEAAPADSTGPPPGPDEVGRFEFPALGTGAVLVTTDPSRLEPARLVVEEEVAAIDAACSRFRDDSELAEVNRRGSRPTHVGPLLFEAIEAALRAARLTDGDVDPTVGEAIRVLGYDRDFADVPAIGRPLVRVAAVPGWENVRLDSRRRLVSTPPGVSLDLGATAKGLAADRAAGRAAAAAGCGVLVSLGGDIAMAGDPPSDGWSVRVADWHAAGPEAGDEVVQVLSGGVATSSTTVRRWSRGAEELHHVVDPATGRSAEVVWRTVSVAAASCLDANIAATAAIVRGERSPAWLESLGLPARLVRTDGSVVRAGGWPAEQESVA